VKPRILLIEDDRHLTELVRDNREGEGFALAPATERQESLLAATALPPNLILLVWMLPHLSRVAV